jgi:hypothetical protein
MVVMGAALAIELWRAAGLIQASPERLGGIGVLIDVLESGKIGALKGWIAGFSWPFEDPPRYPLEVLNRAAGVLRVVELIR